MAMTSAERSRKCRAKKKAAKAKKNNAVNLANQIPSNQSQNNSNNVNFPSSTVQVQSASDSSQVQQGVRKLTAEEFTLMTRPLLQQKQENAFSQASAHAAQAQFHSIQATIIKTQAAETVRHLQSAIEELANSGKIAEAASYRLQLHNNGDSPMNPTILQQLQAQAALTDVANDAVPTNVPVPRTVQAAAVLSAAVTQPPIALPRGKKRSAGSPPLNPQAVYSKEQLGAFLTKDLKEILKRRNKKVSGTKPDLVQRAWDSNPSAGAS